MERVLTPQRVADALGGEVISRNRVVAPGPGHSRTDRSLSVKLDPDAPDGFVVKSFADDSWIDCKAHVRNLVGLHGRGHLERSRPSAIRRASTRTDLKAIEAGDKAALIRRLWDEAAPILRTPAEAYLRSRAIDSLPSGLDEVLRFHPDCLFGAGSEPCLLALVRHVHTNEIQGLHRTALAIDGGSVRKLGRRLLGQKKYGAVKLSGDEDVSYGLAIAEGLETALSAARVGFLPMWCVLDAGNMAAFPVLPGVEALSVIVDHDDAGKDACRVTARRWLDAGREVHSILPNSAGADFNDIAMRSAA